MHNYAKCHHCRICKTYFREGSLFCPSNPWVAPKKGPSSIRLISYKSFQTTLCKLPWLNLDLNSSFKFFYSFTSSWKSYQNQTCDGNSQVLTNTTIFSTFTFWLLFFLLWLRFKHTEYKGSLNFDQNGYSTGKIAWNIKSFSAWFLTILSNLAHLQLPNENLYLVSRGVTSPNNKWSQPFVACTPYDEY